MVDPLQGRDGYPMSSRALKGMIAALSLLAIAGVSLSIVAMRIGEPSHDLGKKEDRLVPPADIGPR
jgi:hypothetical protein